MWNRLPKWNTDVTFTDNDKSNVAEYLEDGGAMWVIGMDILYDFDTSDGDRSAGDFERLSWR